MAEEKTKKPRRESLQDIIDAVAEKENVLAAFRGVKKPVRRDYGAKYLLWHFGGGLCFGLGLLIMLLLAAWLLSNFAEVRAAAGMFRRFAVLLKAR
ncbi:MAG: hypothetical protein LBD99_01990 [Candidatus Margulisbacteria bacterium]|jgi:hypothetical protein|nr:hypothetical protein [Candidatus Margulisiibacteriota bacterium]